MPTKILSGIAFILFVQSCVSTSKLTTEKIKPSYVSDTVLADSDDPAIWINKSHPEKSIVLGTDKDDENGGVYAFTLQGEKIDSLCRLGLKRVNNVDIAYGLSIENKKIDIAVATERNARKLRVFSLPDMQPIDGGGLRVFEDASDRFPMGIALYTRPSDGAIFAIVSAKSGPKQNNLYQYLLQGEANGKVKATLVRKFGNYSDKKEIEAIAVDNELGYVYYSDEQVGIRKYFADPEKGNEELALFGKADFKEDHEGISIYKTNATEGYLVISNQQENTFNIYSRQGDKNNLHQHSLLTKLNLSTNFSDGNDVTSISLPGYPHGLMVAMSDNKTFQFYDWQPIANKFKLRIAEK